MTLHARLGISPEDLSAMMIPIWSFMMRNMYDAGATSSHPSCSSAAVRTSFFNSRLQSIFYGVLHSRAGDLFVYIYRYTNIFLSNVDGLERFADI